MAQYNKTRSNIGQNLESFAPSAGDADTDAVAGLASEFTGIGGGTPLRADRRDPLTDAAVDPIIDGGVWDSVPAAAPELVLSWPSGGAEDRLTLLDLPPIGGLDGSGEDPFLKAARNKSASNATGNLLSADGPAASLAAPPAIL
jgi:hypothetical protein